MGPKNLKMLKLLVPVGAVFILLYVLYKYRQASIEVSLQKRYLMELDEDFKTLSKRFDMLSRELKCM